MSPDAPLKAGYEPSLFSDHFFLVFRFCSLGLGAAIKTESVFWKPKGVNPVRRSCGVHKGVPPPPRRVHDMVVVAKHFAFLLIVTAKV